MQHTKRHEGSWPIEIAQIILGGTGYAMFSWQTAVRYMDGGGDGGGGGLGSGTI